MTSKQRSFLMRLAASQEAIIHIGKAGLTPELVNAVSEALEARELIKINLLKNCFEDGRQLAETLSERTRSQLVQVIGRKIILYRPSKTKPKIVLP